MPLRDIHNLLQQHNTKLATVIACCGKNIIFQGFIATVPHNPIFLELIQYMIKKCQNKNKKCEVEYHSFTQDFYNKLSKQCDVKEGVNKNNIFLFKEMCSKNPKDCYDGLDRLKYCSYITLHNQRVIKTRYADYPWK